MLFSIFCIELKELVKKEWIFFNCKDILYKHELKTDHSTM